ncbi:CCR4-NOT transcription complex subunit 9-like isoform X2 [Macadamia integrifolia]|uniref:CCR4-NOT transcription complex subunit 9-like isoform X2 n=1 Tax=Macadamia integrifolia TaxID=60698 RepID=UPI001C4FFC5F|nr:CCR4-NOT transcription complex subunit 9-like isoform X2 [Macadamia integrifolia]
MADNEELQEEPWEERTLNLLHDSNIDQELSATKSRKRGRKKHSMKWMKTPMAIPEVIVELQEQELRETALRCLSSFLVEKREEDPENYSRTGYFLYNSCGTVAILLQEVIMFYGKMMDGSLNVRSAKRLANVLTLLQSIAANPETRQNFVNSCFPNYLILLVLFETQLEVYEIVRAMALSVVGILCQAREPKIIQWAIKNDMVEVCRVSIQIGNELSKVIAMHILEAILQDWSGISYICSPTRDKLLKGLMETLARLVAYLAEDQDFSPRLLFHILRCSFLLCRHRRGYNIVMDNLPVQIMDVSFQDLLEFPVIQCLLDQLSLAVGKIEKCFPISSLHNFLEWKHAEPLCH